MVIGDYIDNCLQDSTLLLKLGHCPMILHCYTLKNHKKTTSDECIHR